MNNIEAIWALLDEDKARLDDCIIQSAKSPIDLSNRVCDYIISGGGKRIRPLVLLLLARAFEYRGDKHYQLASAVEFIHTATLLHDDVVDESDMRRGKATANRQFGNAAAVLVGDFLYTRAFQIISQELEAAKIIADATNELAMGEVMQLVNINNMDLTEADYFQVIHLKTAVLFSAACRFSAVLADRQDLAENCAQYGNRLGCAFQIADDVLDYTGSVLETGKNIGDDLAEKKMTLPLIHALKNANHRQSKTLREIIQNGDKKRIDEVIDILAANQSVEYARKVAFEQADFAKNALKDLPDSQYKQALLVLVDLAVKRKK